MNTDDGYTIIGLTGDGRLIMQRGSVIRYCYPSDNPRPAPEPKPPPKPKKPKPPPKPPETASAPSWELKLRPHLTERERKQLAIEFENSATG